jgi:hypothetical protein
MELSDGESGLLDVKPVLVFGVFKKLRDPSEFGKVRVSLDMVAWDHGPLS